MKKQERLEELTTYFLENYPEGKIQTDPVKDIQVQHLAALRTFEERVRKEDKPLMEEYENLILEEMPRMLLQEDAEADCAQIERIIRNGIGKAVLFGDLSRFQLYERICKTLCGYAFPNYRLSPVLHGFVTFCMQMDARMVLTYLTRKDERGDFETRGGHMDDIFFLRPEVLIQWAAEKKKKTILQVQFVKNPTAYLGCYKGAEEQDAMVLLRAIKGVDPKLYKTLLCEREEQH